MHLDLVGATARREQVAARVVGTAHRPAQPLELALDPFDADVPDLGSVRAQPTPCSSHETSRGTRTGPCADLARELAAVTGPLRASELIYCWDPDGPADPRGFARADHCDHILWGMDR